MPLNVRRKLLRWLAEKLPPPIYAQAIEAYWRVHPRRREVDLEGREGEILVRKEGLQFFYPAGQSIFGVSRVRPYKRFCSLDEGDVAVDAGATIGRDSLAMAREVGDSGRVVAIEPVPANIEMLRRNVELNGLENVEVVEKGLWSDKGTSELHLAETFTGHSMIEEEIAWGIEGKLEVETDTLDDISADLDLLGERIGLMKFNIEGAEVEALKGAGKALESSEKVLVGTHWSEHMDTTEDVKRLLDSEGFSIEWRKSYVFGRREHAA